MLKCPNCEATTRQNRAGQTEAGSQRYRCMHCQSKYTPEPKQQGYSTNVRKRALETYVDGGNFRRIARHLKVSHRTVSLWVTAHTETLPAAPVPEAVKEAEMDELFTFSGDKKRNLPDDSSGSPNTLYFGLVGCLNSHSGSPPAHGGRSAKSNLVLQRWV